MKSIVRTLLNLDRSLTLLDSITWQIFILEKLCSSILHVIFVNRLVQKDHWDMRSAIHVAQSMYVMMLVVENQASRINKHMITYYVRTKPVPGILSIGCVRDPNIKKITFKYINRYLNLWVSITIALSKENSQNLKIQRNLKELQLV